MLAHMEDLYKAKKGKFLRRVRQMKNKIAKLWVLCIILAVGFSSLNGMAIAANNQVNPTGDAPDGTQLSKNPKDYSINGGHGHEL